MSETFRFDVSHVDGRARRGVLQVRADLREVRSMHGPGVQVEAMRGLVDDLSKEGVREPRRERALGRAGKGAVQVPAIRQVP